MLSLGAVNKWITPAGGGPDGCLTHIVRFFIHTGRAGYSDDQVSTEEPTLDSGGFPHRVHAFSVGYPQRFQPVNLPRMNPKRKSGCFKFVAGQFQIVSQGVIFAGLNTMLISLLSQWTWVNHSTTVSEGLPEPGSALLSLFAFNSVLKAGDRVVPVIPADQETRRAISQVKDYLPFTGFDFMDSHPEVPTRFIHRKWESGDWLDEPVTVADPAIELSIPAETDLIYLSVETPQDLSVSDLKQIRAYYPSAFIYADLQMLPGSFFKRSRLGEDRVKEDLQTLFDSVDAIQVNQRELQQLFFSAGTTEKGLIRMALLEGKARFMVVTRGSRGVVIWERILGQIQSLILRPPAVHPDQQSAGCGHVFGPVFSAGLVRTQQVKSSAIKALNLAALAAAKENFSRKAEHIRLNGALL